MSKPRIAKTYRRKDTAWDKVKRKGSKHYQGLTEPIDLLRAGNLLYPFAIGNIIKYAYRQRVPLNLTKILEDMDKVIHYADMVKAVAKEVCIASNYPNWINDKLTEDRVSMTSIIVPIDSPLREILEGEKDATSNSDA